MADPSQYRDRDESFEEQDPTEEGADADVAPADFASLLISPTDWTIETLYRQIGVQISLDPEFQRRNVWSNQAKISFIESLFLGIPIPQILLATSGSSNKSYVVLDGKQRLLTIKEFMDGKFPNGKLFRLKNLRVLKQLENHCWEDIEGDDKWEFELKNQTQRTAVIRGWSDDRVLYEIFHRLNSGSVKLSPMELRMSLLPGEFLKFVVKWTENVGPLHWLLSKKSADPRMNDVELVVRYLAFRDGRVVYRGDLKKFLDEACEAFNYEFSTTANAEQIFTERLDNMNSAIEAGLDIFPPRTFCRKYLGEGFDTRFNRAVFDVQVGALSNRSVREWALRNQGEFVETFKFVSEMDDFRRSVETTTKSVGSTKVRFSRFFTAIGTAAGIQLSVPAITDGG